MWGELIFSEFSGGKAKKRGETKKLKSHRGKKRGGRFKKIKNLVGGTNPGGHYEVIKSPDFLLIKRGNDKKS